MIPALRTDRAGRTPVERIEAALQRVPGWEDPRQFALPIDEPEPQTPVSERSWTL